MRPALALSALLLLLPPPPALSQDNASEASKDSTTIKPTTAAQSKQDPLATPLSTTKPTTHDAVKVSSVQPSHTVPSKDSGTAVQQTTAPILTSDTKDHTQSGGRLTATSRDNLPEASSPSGSSPPSSNGQPASSGGKNASVTAAPPTTQGSYQPTTSASPQPADPQQTRGLTVTPSQPPPAPTADSTASPGQLAATEAASQTTESSPSTRPGLTAASNSSSPYFSATPTPGKPAHTPPGPSGETQPAPSQTPGTSTAAAPPPPPGAPAGTEGTPTAEESTGSSTSSAPATPRGPSTPASAWTFREYTVKCDPAVMPSEELLILNLTGASLCEGGPPDEKLAELLCRSLKAPFSPARDRCTLQVAPVVRSQAVAVTGVVIETKLSPKAVYELLKDKWDDLTEAGVSDMKLGQEGPPEPNEDRFSLPLIITIVCMASFLLLVAALYGCCHQRISQRKDQQRLTEELQTVENGYHDNPTLEVMETPSEMQEKKVANLNGELGDSWIVPLDNLTKDDLDEEDTHL